MEQSELSELYQAFHKAYYEQLYWDRVTKWFGVKVLKCPFDLMIIQNLIWKLVPDLIIETGTHDGGSALFMSTILSEVSTRGRIITIDLNRSGIPRKQNIWTIQGDSVDKSTIQRVKEFLPQGRNYVVMVLLDSDHSKEHVLQELKLYSQFVTLGSYLIVEDTNLNGHPVEPYFGPGPWEAVHEWIRGTSFLIDTSVEVFPITFNPEGYLLRT